jgi:hypothetical protein
MMEYQPCFKPTVSDDLYFMCAMVVCYMVGVWSSHYHFFYSGFPRFIPMKKWPLPPYLVGGWAYPSEKSESQYESVGMMTFPIYGKIIQMFQTTNQWWSCGKPRHVLTMALAFQLSNLP